MNIKLLKVISTTNKWYRGFRPVESSTVKRYLNISIKSIETVSTCKLLFKNFVSFGKFTTILNQIYKLNTTKASIYTTIAYSIIFYYFVFLSAVGSTLVYLSKVGTTYTVPLFVSVILMKLGLNVRTVTSAEGGVRGNTVADVNIDVITLKLLELDFNEYCDLITASPFSSYSKMSDFEAVKAVIRATLSDFECTTDSEGCDDYILPDNDRLYAQMFGFFTILPSIFYNTQNRIETVDFNLSYGFSRYVNIHRFRNGSASSHYIVNAQSISSLHGTSQAEFACFLKLFKPDFYQGPTCAISLNMLLPNDVIFDLEAITEEQALIFLFELSKTRPSSPSQNRSSSSRSTVRPNRGTTNDRKFEAPLSGETLEKSKRFRDRYLNKFDTTNLTYLIIDILYMLHNNGFLSNIGSIETNGKTIYYTSKSDIDVIIRKVQDYDLNYL